MRSILRSWLVLAAILAGSQIAPAEEANRSIGQQVENFALPDFHGKSHALNDYADAKLVVVAFTGTECPLAKLYAPRLEALWQEFGSRGVQFLGVNSNQQDSITKIATYARLHGTTFPILKDLNNAVADQIGAERTPEVFVLDENRVIRYRGRIDDQYGLGVGSGYAKPEIRQRHLAEAIEQLLDGEPVAIPYSEAPGCIIGRVADVTPHGDITYTKHIAEILQNRCVECHRDGEVAPFTLTDYEDVVGWSGMIREVVNEGRMPPWFANPAHGTFANDARLSEGEKELLFQWIDNGCPEGDAADLPSPRQFTDGWQIEEPDLIVHMDDKPYTVQAEGVVDYQYFEVDLGFTEDKWIKAAEARPGNRAVVHHIIAFIQPPGGNRFGASRGGLAGYAPGMPPSDYPEGVGILVKAGSKLVFQMHYTPNGSVQEDLSYVGMVFAEPGEIKQHARGGMAGNIYFKIPPGDDNYKVTSKTKFRSEKLLLSLTPHMHLRGKSFRYEAAYPDGTREILLDVPRYDFNWQLRYDLAEPKLLPPGTVMHVTAHFDNSENNLANPDPTAEVTFGEQTWEEMMFGFYTTIDPHENLLEGKSSDDDDEREEQRDDRTDQQAAAD